MTTLPTTKYIEPHVSFSTKLSATEVSQMMFEHFPEFTKQEDVYKWKGIHLSKDLIEKVKICVTLWNYNGATWLECQRRSGDPVEFMHFYRRFAQAFGQPTSPVMKPLRMPQKALDELEVHDSLENVLSMCESKYADVQEEGLKAMLTMLRSKPIRQQFCREHPSYHCKVGNKDEPRRLASLLDQVLLH